MAIDITLKLTGIEGESKKDGHVDEIDCYDFSYGVTQTASSHEGSGGGSGRADIHDMVVTKMLDKASPTLYRASAKGLVLDEAVLYVRKVTGDAPLDYLVVTMKKVIISKVVPGGDSSDDRIKEDLALNFAQIAIKYTPQESSGAGGAAVEAEFDVEANI